MASNTRETPKRGRLSNFFFIMLCALILITFALLLRSQTQAYNSLRAENNRLQAELDREKVIYADLRYQMAHFDSDAYIEQLARERLGWVRPGEMVFRKITE